MKILQLAYLFPGRTSGGTLGILQSTKMLSSGDNTIDYIGPAIDDDDIKKMYQNVYELKPTSSIRELVCTFLQLIPFRMYYDWKRVLSKIDLFSYDIFYVDSTRPDYFIKDIKKIRPDAKFVVRAHNVEADLASESYKVDNSLRNLFLKYEAYFREKYIVHNTNSLIAITKEDKQRLIELYDIPENKIYIIPMCLENPMSDFMNHVFGDKCKLLITGSLWFGVNLEGINWFIDNVYPKLPNSCIVRIAGSRPSEGFKKKCAAKNIELIESPESMREHIEWSDIILAPIFSGGGMKVKIVEALSYGRPVITTSFGAIGYELDNYCNSYIADDINSFKDSIMDFFLLKEDKKLKIMKNAYQLYYENYSISVARFRFKEIIKSFIK